MSLDSQFRKDAESIAEEMRADLDLGNIFALDLMAMFTQLELPAISLDQLGAGSDDPKVREAVDYLRHQEHSLSALTVFRGTRRLVVYNDASSRERQASDLAHEAAHGLLLHEPAPALDELGCRAWNNRNEEEAQYLAGCLIIPGKGARYAAKAGWSTEQTARRFGCSEQMAQWRHNVSGGQRVAARNSR